MHDLSSGKHDADSNPRGAAAPRRVLVLGGGDVGSAVAHGLFVRGQHVLISERGGSRHARRGMAFTDAMFDGAAVLDGVTARWHADLAQVPAAWEARVAIPLVTLPEKLITAAFRFDVMIEATMRRNAVQSDLRALAPLTVGLGPGYVPGGNCHVAIETQWGASMGAVLHDRPAAVRSGGPHALAGVKHERFALAPGAGIWRTAATLGSAVRAGDVVGHLGEQPVLAPIDGCLRGVSRDGVTVIAGQRLLEVDPRAAAGAEVFGLGERPRAIARGVLRAMGLDGPATEAWP